MRRCGIMERVKGINGDVLNIYIYTLKSLRVRGDTVADTAVHVGCCRTDLDSHLTKNRERAKYRQK